MHLDEKTKFKMFWQGCCEVIIETSPIAVFGAFLGLLRTGYFATNNVFFPHSYKLAVENYIPITVTTFAVCTCAAFFLIPTAIGFFGYDSRFARFSRSAYNASSKFTISAMWLSVGIFCADQMSRVLVKDYSPVEPSFSTIGSLLLIPLPIIPLSHIIRRLNQEKWGFTRLQAFASAAGFAVWFVMVYVALFAPEVKG